MVGFGASRPDERTRERSAVEECALLMKSEAVLAGRISFWNNVGAGMVIGGMAAAFFVR